MRHRVKVRKPMVNGQEALVVITQGQHARKGLDVGEAGF